MKPIVPNTMIQNRYLIVQMIGQGKTGDVYLAVDQRFGSAVTLKRAFYRGDTARLAAFEREAAVLTRLKHPVLPGITDHFAENDGLFLVIEHISGDDLSKRLDSSNKPFPLSWVMFWADQALDALNYLHSHEPAIVHGDIRPQNLKLTSENHIILLDCGSSVGSIESPEPNAASETDKISKEFASPEKLEGADLDERSDIYALSATLYYLLTNVAPVDAEDRVGAVASGLKDSLKPVTDVNPAAPRRISDVVAKGMALLPGDRFNGAFEMQQELRRAFNKGASDETATLVNASSDPSIGAVTNLNFVPDDPDAVDDVDLDSMAFGATLQMDPIPTVEVPKQSDVKTEVFSAPPGQPTGIKTEILPPPTPSVPAVAAETVPYAGVVSTPQVTPVAAPKAKSSKAGLIVVLLIGLAFIGAAAIGGGWYAYNTYYKSQPTPTPVATPSTPSPSPSPSPVQADETNENTNTANELVDPYDANANRKALTVPTQESPRTQPRVTNPVTPPRTVQKPVTRPTPKPQPRDDRTVILQ